MPYAAFDKTTGAFLWASLDALPFDAQTEVRVETDAVLPSDKRWDTAAQQVRDATAAERLAEGKATKAALARSEGSRRLQIITADYTPEERDTWAQQAREADAWTASADAADAPMLAAMATTRSITLAEMVGKVNAARAAFTAAAGATLGAQQALETAINAAADQAALDAIDPTDPANWP